MVGEKKPAYKGFIRQVSCLCSLIPPGRPFENAIWQATVVAPCQRPREEREGSDRSFNKENERKGLSKGRRETLDGGRCEAGDRAGGGARRLRI